MSPPPLMQAVVQTAYGAPDEVLVRVRAASIHPGIWHTVTGRPTVLRLMGSGLLRPQERIAGTNLADHAEAVGRDVDRLRPGDAVFGEPLRCMAWRNGGTYAEYAVAPADNLAPNPPGVTFEEAATVPTSGLIALINLHREWLGPDRRVLVNGAGGGVGSIAVQLARASGVHVTAAERPEKLDLVSSLGAHRVLDATREELAGDGEGYELILDVALPLRLAGAKPLLTPVVHGTYPLERVPEALHLLPERTPPAASSSPPEAPGEPRPAPAPG